MPLYKDTEAAEILLDKIPRNEEVRKELQSVRKEARAKAKKVALKITAAERLQTSSVTGESLAG